MAAMQTIEYTSHRAELGWRIRRLREEQGLSTRKFSLMVGVSRTHLLALESGESSPTFDMLERISAGLGVTPAQLVNFSVEFDHIKLM